MRIFDRLLGHNQVAVCLSSGEFIIPEAFKRGDYWFVEPITSVAMLLPNGAIAGKSYIESWKPISHNMKEFFKSA